LRRGLLTFEESALLMRRFEDGLSGYTYLEEEEAPMQLGNGAPGPAPAARQDSPADAQALETEAQKRL
jgi:hypothetical protein